MSKVNYQVINGVTRKLKKVYVVSGLNEPALPEGYTRLNYVYSGGSSWFDTNFKPNQNTKVELDFQLTSTATHIFGARSSYMDKAFCVCWLSDMPFVVQIANNTYSIGAFDMTLRYKLEMTANVFKLNNETKATYSVDNFQCTENMWLFSCPNGSDTENSSGYIFEAKVYDNNTLIRHYIPAMNSSGVVGFYDFINNTFGGSITSTPFSGGEEVQYITREVKRKYVVRYPDNERLPEGYTRISYVHSDATAWFDTNFKPNQNTRVVIDMQPTSTYTHIFGTRSGYKDRGFVICWASDAHFTVQVANSEFSAGTFDTSARYLMEMTANNFKLNGEIKATYSVGDFQCAENMWLFSSPNGSDTENSSGYIFSCKIYDGNTLVRHYVPARNSSGIVGFYDFVNKNFGGSITNTSFTGGNEVEYITCLCYQNE